MATHIGTEGIAKVGANTVAEVLSFTVTEEAEMVEDTQSSDAAKTYISGQTSWSGEVICHWDETDTNGQESMTVGASITLNLYPEGDTTGDIELSGTALIQTVAINMEGGNNITGRTFSVQGTGALAKGPAS